MDQFARDIAGALKQTIDAHGPITRARLPGDGRPSRSRNIEYRGGGFLGGEYGQTGDQDGFAAKLGDMLSESR